ncbi:MAG: AAA-like domain-containing protein, partial [Lachnospiraceae bacterium]|nr:AAA-like domain-containing protein [Lachnospiraceae bacterium]
MEKGKMKKFNTTGKCIPEKHYMVDISDRVNAAVKMVDDGTYFTINRGRQYGKTTLLAQLKKALEDQYLVYSISFEGIENEIFESAAPFYMNFFGLLYDEGILNEGSDILKEASEDEKITGRKASGLITEICRISKKPVVLIIDEVDQAGNFDMFIKFLGLLRKKYLEKDEKATFQSVILAGVYDVKNLKLKIRSDEEHQYNSPWNIADSFEADMSFSAKDIETMLKEYENEHESGMDIGVAAREIEAYTSGYPF